MLFARFGMDFIVFCMSLVGLLCFSVDLVWISLCSGGFGEDFVVFVLDSVWASVFFHGLAVDFKFAR